MTALDRAVQQLGSVQKLADALGLSQQVVSNWRLRGSVPPDRCRAIQEVTRGKVRCHELRPDVFIAPRRRKAA